MRHYLSHTSFLKENNSKFHNAMQATCQPLFDCFPITHAFYITIKPNGRFLLLASDITIVNHVLDDTCSFENIFFEKIHFIKGLLKYIWPSSQSHVSSYNLLVYSLGLAHGFNVAKRKPDHSLEFFIFATQPSQHDIYNIYLNHSNFFERFVFYFQAKMKTIIESIPLHHWFFSSFYQANMPSLQTPSTEHLKNFICQTFLRKYYVSQANGLQTTLSCRQAECLYQFTLGRTAKEIAQMLHISHRTVQTHLNTIKDKTHNYTRAQASTGLSPQFKTFFETNQGCHV